MKGDSPWEPVRGSSNTMGSVIPPERYEGGPHARGALVQYFIDGFGKKVGKELRTIDRKSLDLPKAYAHSGHNYTKHLVRDAHDSSRIAIAMIEGRQSTFGALRPSTFATLKAGNIGMM